MTERIIELSDSPVFLSINTERLVIRSSDGQEKAIPLSEVAVVICSHPSVTLTQAVLAGLANHGGMFVACDAKRMPAAMLLPMDAHHQQAGIFAQQVSASEPTRKRLWQQIVKAKIASQARTLQRVHGSDEGLALLADRVRSGDPDNVEGLASRRYWPLLFGSSFHRDREAEDQNRLLNYGYMAMRALVARAVCAAGLHPSFGLHHRSQSDPFVLADDLVEPFRCLVDRTVTAIIGETGPQTVLDKTVKAKVLGTLLGRYVLQDEERSLFDIAARVSVSLAAILQGNEQHLVLPEF